MRPPRKARRFLAETALVLAVVPYAGSAKAAESLTQAEAASIVARTVAAATAEGVKATVVVTDREANVLAAFRMAGAPASSVLSGGGRAGQGLEGATVPALFAAISKAGTASFFGTRGNAFTTRTASYIVQQHFPPTVDLQAGGPLFGVQLSSLPCTDVTVPRGAASGFLPLGLSADPGGVPLYKNGEPVGGLGVEGDGVYGADRDPLAEEKAEAAEERVAVAGSRGFEAPEAIRGTEILVNGLRLPFTEVAAPRDVAAPTYAAILGAGAELVAPRAALPSRFLAASAGGAPGFVLVDPPGSASVRFPSKPSASGRLTAADVDRILAQAARTAAETRAAIRQPLGSAAEVSITVVDEAGEILGFFRTADAPVFGVDVSAQKARAAAFFSSPGAAAALTAAGLGAYVSAAAADGVRLDGSVAFSDRGIGFLARPFYPDGIDGSDPGPLSRPIGDWSVFNTGLQTDLVAGELARLVAVFTGGGGLDNTKPCSSVPGLGNGLQIFAGSVPLYKNGAFAGAIGISGDGIDQDDFIAASGSVGFEAPKEKRSDRVFVRGVRLPFVKFPRHPKL